MKTIITFIIVFGVIVVVHEFGHFFFAKRSGILVREFAIGMGPKIFSHRRNGTTYTIRILPLGGYVRMAGAGEEEENITPGMPVAIELNEQNIVKKINTSKKVTLPNSIPMEVSHADLEEKLVITGLVNGQEEMTTYQVDHDATIIEEDGTEVQIAPKDVQFQSAKLYQRMLTNFAGPMNNFILGIVLFALLAFLQGGIPDSTQAVIGSVIKDQPAAQAGLKVGDKVKKVDGKKIASYEEFTTIIQKNPSKTVVLEVERNHEQKSIQLTPKATKENNQTVGKIGVTNAIVVEKASVFAKIKYGFTAAFSSSLAIFKALGNLFNHFSLNKLGGPVMIFKLSSNVASQGVIAVISFMAMLSMNLGIMNLLPIPALDGGKLVLNIFEGLRGKPLSQEKEGMLTLVGAGILVVLMVLVTWNDITRFFF